MKSLMNKITLIIIIVILSVSGIIVYFNGQSKNLKKYAVIDLNTKSINKIRIEEFGVISEEGLVAVRKDGLWRLYR